MLFTKDSEAVASKQAHPHFHDFSPCSQCHQITTPTTQLWHPGQSSKETLLLGQKDEGSSLGSQPGCCQ